MVVLFLFFTATVSETVCNFKNEEKNKKLRDTEIFGPMFYVDFALVSLVQDESQALTLGGALIFQFQLWQITDRFR